MIRTLAFLLALSALVPASGLFAVDARSDVGPAQGQNAASPALPAQVFFDRWLERLTLPVYAKSRARAELEASIMPGFERWLIDSAIQVSNTQVRQLLSPSAKGTMNETLRMEILAWSYLRNSQIGVGFLRSLPRESELRPRMARLIAQVRANGGDTRGGISLLEEESKLVSHPELLAIGLARLYFAQKDFASARKYYESVPVSSREYVIAHEELAWTLLKQGDTERLRGQLAHLASPAFKDSATPETFLIRSISDIVLCNYDSVRQDFRDFIDMASERARRAEVALEASIPPPPVYMDYFSLLAERRVEKREADLQAIGLSARDRLKLHSEYAQALTERKTEFRRQWAADQAALADATKKMRFAKVVWMSAMRGEDPKIQANRNDSITLSSAHPIQAEGDSQIYPYDGVLWSDEIFKLHAETVSRCMKTGGSAQ